MLTPEALKLAGLVLPLGLDTFAVSLALGMAGLPASRRLRLSFLFAGFESAMPLLGVVLGAPLGRAIGATGDYLAGALIVGLGLYMLLLEDEQGERLPSLGGQGLLGSVALGLSISLDELAIGFSAGLLRLPVLAIVIAIAAQAFVVTQLGLRLGERVGKGTRELAERLAGLALIALGAILLAGRLAA